MAFGLALRNRAQGWSTIPLIGFSVGFRDIKHGTQHL